MLFNSFDFLLFLIVVVSLFWLVPVRFKWILLLTSSYFFYISWEPLYIFLILFSTGIDYILCLKFTSSSVLKRKKIGLYLSIFLNLGLLFSFKYYNFFQGILIDFAALFDWEYRPNQFSVLLPVGISFYTFQTLSYSIDIYKGTLKPEKHLGKFALFVSFFPQLIAGPIERAKDLLPQLNGLKSKFQMNYLKEGICLVLFGLFMKVVVADNAAIIVDSSFHNYLTQSGAKLAFSTFLFSIQIYGDFGGYSLIALGAARMFGIQLLVNFKQPYLAFSLTDFWRRWHISLSRWFKDYVYIPLGGNQRGKIITYRNLLITMLVAGLWHGAAWTFIVWGLIHGLILFFEKMFMPSYDSRFLLSRVLKCLLTFTLVSLLWIVFRAESLGQAAMIIKKIFSLNFKELYIVLISNMFSGAVLALLILFPFELALKGKSIYSMFQWRLRYRYGLFIIVFLMILVFGVNEGRQFIYFQF
jgi:alginate O-acetyltransferase complex protein AlgI